MRKGATIWAGCIILMGVGIFWVGRAGGAAENEPQPEKEKAFKPVTDLEDLMEGQDLMFKGIRKAISSGKMESAETEAWILAELANVNIHNAKKPHYADFAQDMSDKSVTLAKALKSKDQDAAKKALTNVGSSCKACHDQFRKRRKH